MRVVLTAAFSALMLSPCVAATEKTAQSEDSVICRPANAKTRAGTHLPSSPVCHTANKWAQIEEQKRRFVEPNINTGPNDHR